MKKSFILLKFGSIRQLALIQQKISLTSDLENGFMSFFLIFLGKVTWHEYFALYIKFHNVNSTGIKETDTFDFVQGPFDNNCK
jgi:hypothetical protein